MTTTAHNSRKVYGGASLAKNMEPPDRVSPHSMYEELYPYMYKRKSRTASPMAAEIRAWLAENSPATASEIAKGIGRDCASSVAHALRSGVDGAIVVGEKMTKRGMVAVWGLKEE